MTLFAVSKDAKNRRGDVWSTPRDAGWLSRTCAAAAAALMLSAGAAAAQSEELITNCVAEAGVVGKFQIQYVTSGGVETASVPPALAVSAAQSAQINDCIARSGLGTGVATVVVEKDRYIAFNVKTGRCLRGVFERGTEYCIRDASEVVLAR